MKRPHSPRICFKFFEALPHQLVRYFKEVSAHHVLVQPARLRVKVRERAPPREDSLPFLLAERKMGPVVMYVRLRCGEVSSFILCLCRPSLLQYCYCLIVCDDYKMVIQQPPHVED